MRNLLFVLLLLGGMGCQQPAAPALDPDEVKTELEARWATFAESWEAFDAPACAGLFFPDGINMPPGNPTCTGRREIADFYRLLFNAHLSADYEHTIDELSVGGEQVVERGHFLVKWTRRDSSVWNFNARSLVHWQQDDTGNWYARTFIFNTVPATE
jgi:ketosteroid isomerase-like protein